MIRAMGGTGVRGAVGAEPNTGDGAGILMQLPHKFMAKVAKAEGV